MNPPPGFILPEKIGSDKLCEIFNENQARILKQTTSEVTTYEELAPPCAGQVAGTMSFVKDWYGWNEAENRSRLIATVHYFKRPDGTIGASGKKDPKVLIIDGRHFIDP